MIALFRSLPKIHNHSENVAKKCFENWVLCLFRQFWFHDNRTVQNSHYCTSLACSGVQFFVLPSVTRNATPRYLNFSTCFNVAPFTCNTHWSGFLERWRTSVLAMLILFRWCCMYLRSYLMPAGGQILWKKAEPNHQRIADDWFCNFQMWHTHQLGRICRSNLCKQWKGDKTHPCLSPTPTWKGFDCLPFTRTQTSGLQ